MAKNDIVIDYAEIPLNVHIKVSNEFRIRSFIGILFMRIGSFILPVDAEIKIDE